MRHGLSYRDALCVLDTVDNTKHEDRRYTYEIYTSTKVVALVKPLSFSCVRCYDENSTYYPPAPLPSSLRWIPRLGPFKAEMFVQK